MADVRDFVFDILKAAIWNVPVCTPEGFGAEEWCRVHYVLSLHGLAAFAYDAVTAMPDAMKPPKAVSLRFISSVVASEHMYAKLAEVDRRLNELISDFGYKALRLKGFTLAAYYPKPSSRRFGDIDIYSPDKGDAIDDCFRSKGIEVDNSFYRHSHCCIKGVSIENHKCLLDIRGRKRMREMDSTLKNMASDILRRETSPALYNPDAFFSAIFNLHHSLSHFIYEGVTLKFLTDWILFLKSEREVMNTERMEEMLHAHGLIKYAGLLTRVSIDHLGLTEDNLPPYLFEAAETISPELENKFIEDMFRPYQEQHYENKVKVRINNIRRIVKSSWKTKEFLGQSSFSFICGKAIPILLGKNKE